MNVLPAIYFMLIFSMLSAGLHLKIQERARSIVPDRVQNGITQIALAQYRYISDIAVSGGNYAGDFATLKSGGHLPIWEDEIPPKYTMTVIPGLQITYEAENQAEAGRVAARIGSTATVSGDNVTVGFADPLDLALLDLFLPLDGSKSMQGTLSFNSGIGNAVELGGNNLVGAERVETETLEANEITVEDGGTGIIKTDILISRTATFDDILINP